MGKFLFALALILGAASISHAATEPCAADKEKFCSKVKVGANRMTKCFADNDLQLAPECKKSRDALKPKLTQIKEVCQDDFERYCKDKDVARDEVKKCLKQHRQKLSRVCKREMKNEKKARKARKAVKQKRLQIKKTKANADGGT